MRHLLIFLFLLDNDIIDHIVEQTNLYATQKHPGAHYKWQPTCNDEMKLFLGMIVAMGVHRLPQVENYWLSDILFGVLGIVGGMPIDCFKVLLQCLQLMTTHE